jgi:hypothetical protein
VVLCVVCVVSAYQDAKVVQRVVAVVPRQLVIDPTAGVGGRRWVSVEEVALKPLGEEGGARTRRSRHTSST